VKGTAEFHHEITHTLLPQADPIFDDATPAFAEEYTRRAGIEGTLSYGIRACGLRRSRYIGLARTHVQHVLTAAAMNLARVARWLADEPRARTRRSPLLRLQQAT
jgi:hypothetical protein